MNQEILELLAEKKYSAVKQLIGQMEEADLAKLFEELENEEDADQFNRLFRLLPKETAAEVFSYMEPEIQEKIVRTLTDTELQHILDDLFMDDYVDLVEEMPANVVKRVMQNTTPANRKLINQYLKYPEDSAGSLMTNEYVYFRSGITVAKAFEIIREYGVDKETIYTCYVTDAQRKLIGSVSVKDLLINDYDTVIGKIMETDVISCETTDDEEAVAQTISKYDLSAIPVVDTENRIVGIITVDDIIDVMQDEATEDMALMAAMTPTDEPYLTQSVWQIWKSRIPWLLILMVSATFTGLIINTYEGMLNHLSTLLFACVPMLMDTGGNAGGQASVTVIRGLALDEVHPRDVLQVLWKEFRVGLMLAAVLAVTCFAKLLLIDNLLFGYTYTWQLCLVVSLSLFATVVIAKAVGCLMPLLAKTLHLDPAVVASPVITTIVDALSLMIFCAIAINLLPTIGFTPAG